MSIYCPATTSTHLGPVKCQQPADRCLRGGDHIGTVDDPDGEIAVISWAHNRPWHTDIRYCRRNQLWTANTETSTRP